MGFEKMFLKLKEDVTISVQLRLEEFERTQRMIEEYMETKGGFI